MNVWAATLYSLKVGVNLGGGSHGPLCALRPVQTPLGRPCSPSAIVIDSWRQMWSLRSHFRTSASVSISPSLRARERAIYYYYYFEAVVGRYTSRPIHRQRLSDSIAAAADVASASPDIYLILARSLARRTLLLLPTMEEIRGWLSPSLAPSLPPSLSLSLSPVCVCVCERERERESRITQK